MSLMKPIVCKFQSKLLSQATAMLGTSRQLTVKFRSREPATRSMASHFG